MPPRTFCLGSSKLGPEISAPPARSRGNLSTENFQEPLVVEAGLEASTLARRGVGAFPRGEAGLVGKCHPESARLKHVRAGAHRGDQAQDGGEAQEAGMHPHNASPRSLPARRAPLVGGAHSLKDAASPSRSRRSPPPPSASLQSHYSLTAHSLVCRGLLRCRMRSRRRMPRPKRAAGPRGPRLCEQRPGAPGLPEPLPPRPRPCPPGLHRLKPRPLRLSRPRPRPPRHPSRPTRTTSRTCSRRWGR